MLYDLNIDLIGNLIFNKNIYWFLGEFIGFFLANLNSFFLFVNFSFFLFMITLLIFFIFESVLRGLNSFLSSLPSHTNSSSLQLISRIISIISTLFATQLIGFLSLPCRHYSFILFFWFMRKCFILILTICLFHFIIINSFLFNYLPFIIFPYTHKIV